MSAAAWIARWRVRLGYLVGIVVLVFARPTPLSIAGGAILGAYGLFIRAYAAGYLHKQSVLTTSGPYAQTRNPLYLGSAILALGAAVAMYSLVSAAVLAAYFLAVYSVVMRREEGELRARHGEAFENYARAVPLLFPRLTPAKLPRGEGASFSFARYKRNHEFEAAIGFVLLLAVLLVLWRWPLHRFLHF